MTKAIPLCRALRVQGVEVVERESHGQVLDAVLEF